MNRIPINPLQVESETHYYHHEVETMEMTHNPQDHMLTVGLIGLVFLMSPIVTLIYMVFFARRVFIGHMVARFIEKGGVPYHEAVCMSENLMREFLFSEGIKFGCKSYKWDKAAADDMVDTEMSYWS